MGVDECPVTVVRCRRLVPHRTAFRKVALRIVVAAARREERRVTEHVVGMVRTELYRTAVVTFGLVHVVFGDEHTGRAVMRCAVLGSY